MSNTKKVLVTGGAGFIGSHLVNALVQKGYDVKVMDDLSFGAKENLKCSLDDIEFFEKSILDRDALKKAAAGCSKIFHLAAHTSVQRSVEHPIDSHAVNTTGTLNVLEAAKDISAKVIFSSTSSYYGDNPNLPLLEHYCPNPVSPYGAHKVLGEHYLNVYKEVHGLEGIALRYFNVYGPRQNSFGGYSGVIKIFKEKIQKGQNLTIFGDGKQTRDFIYIKDIVNANIIAAESDVKHGSFNIGTGIGTDVNTIAKMVIETMRAKVDIEYKPHRPGDPIQVYCDPKYTEENLGFKAKTSLKDGMPSALCDDESALDFS